MVPILQWLLVFPVKEGVMGTSGDLFIAMIQNMLIGVCYVSLFLASPGIYNFQLKAC